MRNVRQECHNWNGAIIIRDLEAFFIVRDLNRIVSIKLSSWVWKQVIDQGFGAWACGEKLCK